MFTLQDGRECLYQWDLDRKVIVDDGTISEVHFCNKTDECSLVVETYSSDGVLVADIPNILLQTDFPIRVYAYCADGYTKVENIFKVKSRTRPNDYVYTETQTKTWTELAQKADDTLHTAQVAINSIDDYKEDIEAELEDYKERVRLLELANKGHTYDFISTNDIAAVNNVPLNTMNHARVDSIEGYSKKWEGVENLFIWQPNTDIGTSNCNEYSGGYENGGGDFHAWTDENGYLCIDSKGADTGISTWIELPNSLMPDLPTGTKITYQVKYIDGYADGGYAEGDKPCLTFGLFSCYDYPNTEGEVATGTETYYNYKDSSYPITFQCVGCFSNYRVQILVVEGESIPEDKPYYEGFKHAKVTSIKSYGKNLADVSKIRGSGIAVSNDVITIKTTSSTAGMTANVTLKTICPNVVAGETYFLSATTTGKSNYIYFKSISTAWYFGKSLKITEKMLEDTPIFYASGNSTTATITEFMVNKGTTASPYAPYVGLLSSYAVPEGIKSIDGYGVGISSTVCNKVDFLNKTFVKKVGVVDLGTLTWTTAATNTSGKHRFVANFADVLAPSSDSENANILCDKYNTITSTKAYNNIQGVAVSKTGKVCVYDEQRSSLSAETFAKEMQGVLLCYEMSTPIVDDAVSEYIPEPVCLKVEANGQLVVETENDMDGKVGFTYQVKL